MGIAAAWSPCEPPKNFYMQLVGNLVYLLRVGPAQTAQERVIGHSVERWLRTAAWPAPSRVVLLMKWSVG